MPVAPAFGTLKQKAHKFKTVWATLRLLSEQNAELEMGLGGGESPKHAQGTRIDPSSEKNKEEVEEEDAMGKEEERNASENTLWTESCTVSS